MEAYLEKNGISKKVKLGFSWTTFFFGLFVPLIRGDLKWAGIFLGLSILAGSFTFGIGSTVVGIVMSFKYNQIYAKGLIENGWKAVSDFDAKILKENGILGNFIENNND
mgnify:CR=1 FL=1|jgi:Protein of unknown function (DUF2628).